MDSFVASVCQCGDDIGTGGCGNGWCIDCVWCHENRSEVGISWFCTYHDQGILPEHHCKRWEYDGD